MLAAHLHVVLRLRINGAVPAFPHIPSWLERGQIYLKLSLSIWEKERLSWHGNYSAQLMTEESGAYSLQGK